MPGAGHRRPGRAPAGAREGTGEASGAAGADAQAALTAPAAARALPAAAAPCTPRDPPAALQRAPQPLPLPEAADQGPGSREWPGRERRPQSRPLAGAAPGLPGDDSAERSVTGPQGPEAHAGSSLLTAGHPCHGEGPGLPQGSRRRFSLSGALQAAIIGQLAPRLPRPPVRSRRAPPWCADTPPHAGPRPLRLSVARVRRRAPPAGRAPLPLARAAPAAGASAPRPQRCAEPSRAEPAVCALQGGPLLPWAAGVAAGDGRPLPQRAQVLGLRGKLWPLSRAGSARCPAAGCPPGPLPTYRAPTGCSARFAAAGCPAHLPCGWRVWAAGPWGDAAGAGRLHLLSELPSRVCGRRSDPGGDAGLSASIGEDAVPCPTGAVVSPLKKPEPHCSRR